MATTARGDATRARILDAALLEFSRHGFAGARVDRIAHASQANKNLIYTNFGGKRELFTRVLEYGLQDSYRSLPTAATDLGAFAGSVFDLAHANPDLYRLIEWAILEGPELLPHQRGAFYARTVASVREGQRRGVVTAVHSPEFLVTMTMAMATAWLPAFPFGTATRQGGAPEDARAQLVRAVSAIAAVER
jgi:AcrR family transcriptional regulator